MFGFDIDGVVADSYDVMCKKVSERAMVSFLKPMSYDPHNKIDSISKPEFIQLFTEAVINNEIRPTEGAIETLREYYDKTKRLIFITHRNANIIQETKDWLRSNLNLPYELYQCYKCEKYFIAKDIGVTGFIDDLPETVESFINNGMTAYLYDSPWHLYEDFDSNLPTVKNWHDIRKIIMGEIYGL